RFWSWAYANFNKLQADILRQHIGERFITTNFMPFHLDANPADMMDALTLFAWDSYPVSGAGKAHVDETYRLADPAAISIIHDQMASYTGRWALLEVQPGQVNWSGVPVLLYPGAVRLWLWTAYAHGAEFITTYRYRQPRFGTELFHHGLTTPDGVTLSAGGREFVQVVDEMKMLGVTKPSTTVSSKAATPVATSPSAAAKPRSKQDAPQPVVGLVFDFEQLWYFHTLAQAKRWSQPRWLVMWYAAAARLGLEVKIIRPDQAIPPELPIVIAPGMQMVDEALVQQWDDYAHSGGHLLLTCRTGLMDRTGQTWEGPHAKPIVPLIGATIEAYDGLPDDTWAEVEMDGVKHAWNVWGDLLYAEPTTKVLAKYSNQFYAGAVAATRNRRGKGTVTYCGVYSEQTFVDAMLEKLARDAGVPVSVLPPRVHLLKRGAHRILLNYQDKPITAPAPKGTKFLVGSATVEPAGVAVWEDV
ncbi:MAG: beta-galactosidase trimerization domain-containing protein, partial [Anaerolineae bacterium]|nr:beta-galactosidase trimerization domain-containing protein [Phycisphaerae bacterium]